MANSPKSSKPLLAVPSNWRESRCLSIDAFPLGRGCYVFCFKHPQTNRNKNSSDDVHLANLAILNIWICTLGVSGFMKFSSDGCSFT